MSQEMSFAQALTEAKSVIVQLSNRVKTDAEKIRAQQQTIVAQSASITATEEKLNQQEEQLTSQAAQIADMSTCLKELQTAREAADAMINRQGEKIGVLEGTNADLLHQIADRDDRIKALEAGSADLVRQIADREERIATLIQERDALKAQLPTDEDAAALASMTALLAKAGPVLEKVKKTSGCSIRLSDTLEAQAA